MKKEIVKVTPQDVYDTILSMDNGSYHFYTCDGVKTVKTKPSGNDFVDALAQCMGTNMMSKVWLYEQQLGLPSHTLSKTVLACTGMSIQQWRSDFIMLAAQELFMKTYYDLETIGKRLGFSGAKSFSRWFIAQGMGYPSALRQKWHKSRIAKEKELFQKWKNEVYKE